LVGLRGVGVAVCVGKARVAPDGVGFEGSLRGGRGRR
jgi:hypothetical protein